MKKVIYILAAIILFVFGKILLQGDYTSFLKWWITILYIGIIFMPLTGLVFKRFHDRGYLFSKTIGIAVTGYVMWFLSSLKIMKFNEASCLISVIICLFFNGLILIFSKKEEADRTRDGFHTQSLLKNPVLDAVLFEELMFFALFLLFTYIRGFKPEAYGTEKFMDYGFMTSMMRSDYMPPQDFWFSGTKLNYYYVGQYLSTFLTKLSYVKVSSGYNLALMMVGAFSFVLPYSLVYNIILQFMKEKEKVGKLVPAICGLFGGTAVTLAGNMHYPVYQWLEPLTRIFFGMEPSTEKYWFPDATRFIGYHPETNDKTIHEFPAYSFVLGDLHAHVINIMFVLTVLGILFAWQHSRRMKQQERIPLWKEIINPLIILIAFYIGLFHTTNFWDFPIYFVVSGAVILFTNMVVYNFKWAKVAYVTALQGISVILFSEVVSLPFTLNFDQISTNICLTYNTTPINQLIILWGLPVFMVVAFLCFMVSNFVNANKEQRKKESKNKVTESKATESTIYENIEIEAKEQHRKVPLFFRFMENLTGSDLFILTIGLCAIGLVILPEIVYVEDIYSGDFKRANTMFKLTYQAFIMFGVSFGYIFLRLLCFGNTWKQKKTAIVGLILFGLSVCYIQNAVNAWYGNIFDRKGYQGQDATAFMETTMPDDDLAINWLNDNITAGMPVVLEAPGDSYTDYQRVSVMTGLPTILGWRTHEWLWKSDTEILDQRAADIELIYTSTDEAEVRKLLKEYEISYLYVGKLEEEKYPSVNHELLKSLGKVVFISPANETKAYETYIMQVKY
jgi:YYY domain-containing protein